MSLFWRLFTANAALLIAAAAVLGLSPATVSWPIAVTEAVVLGGGLAGMLAVNAVLLRVALAPLTALAERMNQVDLLDRPQPLASTGRGPVAALVAAFNEMLARLEAERRTSSRRAVTAQEAERQRVAAELHDEIGQAMTGVLMQLARLADGVAADRQGELRDAQRAVRSTVVEVARIAQELRPRLLDHLGLVSALAELARTFSHRTGIAVDCRLDAYVPALNADVELAAYRIVQESLTNVARHAHARHVGLTMQVSGGRMLVEVLDDGVGLPADRGGGSGLAGMRERALLVGGRLTVTDRPGGGVRVGLDLPSRRADR